ncbi:hypothetical protein Q5P01_008615 [Channa striata]|uniref:Uncharacterized protein n=1 Tax=Channa striata TaxID=64152 RepID=A0AA88MZN9_CHASR|nr:hypothetical protein Q5P01_008615 [Channa striata]
MQRKKKEFQHLFNKSEKGCKPHCVVRIMTGGFFKSRYLACDRVPARTQQGHQSDANSVSLIAICLSLVLL